jgi:hypothetical protein
LSTSDEQQALAAATQALLVPLARLLVARGVPFAVAEEGLKKAMVQAARDAHTGGLPHRLVSRISTSTGINRREVTRLTRAPDEAPPPRSLASAIFTRWRSSPEWRDSRGRPRTLARQGEGRSFEALARSVTQDVHPRSLLDELLRLGLATHDAQRDVVSLALDTFVPTGDRARMLEFLADNVGDHLSAAVANVLGRQPPHPERAVFVDELSEESAAAAQAWIATHWQALFAAIVPFLEGLGVQDAEHAASERRWRLRAGLFGYVEEEAGDGRPPAARAEAAAPTIAARGARTPARTTPKTAAAAPAPRGGAPAAGAPPATKARRRPSSKDR